MQIVDAATPTSFHLPMEEGLATGAIAEHDLSLVRRKILEDGTLSGEVVDEAVEEYRKFMMLLRLDHQHLAMCSSEVDAVWHTHILFTRDYADFCHRVFGRFVHHEPVMAHAQLDTNAVREFHSAYRSVFGPVPRIWESCRPIASATLCIPT